MGGRAETVGRADRRTEEQLGGQMDGQACGQAGRWTGDGPNPDSGFSFWRGTHLGFQCGMAAVILGFLYCGLACLAHNVIMATPAEIRAHRCFLLKLFFRVFCLI